MTWRPWRRLLLPTWVLIGTTLSACNLNFSALDTPGLPNPPGGPTSDNPFGPRIPDPAIVVVVRPSLTDSLRKVFGSISEGSYLDSLRVQSWVRDPTGVAVAMRLWTGHPEMPSLLARPGTYDITIAAPGYVTWDTTGVVVEAGRSGIGGILRSVHLSVRLEPSP